MANPRHATVILINPHSTLRLRFPQRRSRTSDFSKVEIKTIDLGHNTYRLEGQGGNITVAGGSGASSWWTGSSPLLHDEMKAAIAAISPLTHQDFDQHPFPRRSHRRQS